MGDRLRFLSRLRETDAPGRRRSARRSSALAPCPGVRRPRSSPVWQPLAGTQGMLAPQIVGVGEDLIAAENKAHVVPSESHELGYLLVFPCHSGRGHKPPERPRTVWFASPHKEAAQRSASHDARRRQASAAVLSAQRWPKCRNRTRFPPPRCREFLVGNGGSPQLGDPDRELRSGGQGCGGS
jgi:hypothetical protein